MSQGSASQACWLENHFKRDPPGTGYRIEMYHKNERAEKRAEGPTMKYIWEIFTSLRESQKLWGNRNLLNQTYPNLFHQVAPSNISKNGNSSRNATLAQTHERTELSISWPADRQSETLCATARHAPSKAPPPRAQCCACGNSFGTQAMGGGRFHYSRDFWEQRDARVFLITHLDFSSHTSMSSNAITFS